MASVDREPITGVWGQSPQRGPVEEPLVRGPGGQSTPEAESFLKIRHPKEGANWGSLLWRAGSLLRCAGWWWVSDFRRQVTTQRPTVPQMLS